MPRRIVVAVAVCLVGCDSPPNSNQQSIPAGRALLPPVVATPGSSVPNEQPKQVAYTQSTPPPQEQLTNRHELFTLSDAAVPKVHSALKAVPQGTHLVVSVDVDDEKYCTGFHYNLAIKSNPSELQFVLLHSQGIAIAIEKDDVPFLNGTQLDYATLESGESGFVFRNPNENLSMLDELRTSEEQ